MSLVVIVCTATVIVTSVYVMHLVINVCTTTVIVTSVYVMYFAVNVCTALGVTSVYVTDLFLIGEQLLV